MTVPSQATIVRKKTMPTEKKRPPPQAFVPGMEKYWRAIKGKRVLRHVKDKKLRGELAKVQTKHFQAAESAARAEILLDQNVGCLEPESALEKTYKLTQHALSRAVDINTQRKIFRLDLSTFGPYVHNYSRNGRNVLLTGMKGHVAVLDSLRSSALCEFHVHDEIHDATFLHNHTMIALAQRKCVYIYDQSGSEVHCLRETSSPLALTYLPYHYLLVSIGQQGLLRYQDTSTGQLIATYRTKLGSARVLAQNPYNAICHVGHGTGQVSLWSPNVGEPLVKMQCHQGPVLAMAMSGQHTMVTSGVDRQVKIWDLRKYESVRSSTMPRPVTSLDLSQRNDMLALGFGPNVHVWQDVVKRGHVSGTQTPPLYMTEVLSGHISTRVRFQPFEDVLSVSTDKSWHSLVVPGSGEPNFDSFEANPFETSKQRRETEVRGLLEKLRPEMITLEPFAIGSVEREAREVPEESDERKDTTAVTKKHKMKKKMRGRNKIGKKMKRKQENVVDTERQKYREKLQEAAQVEKHSQPSKDDVSSSNYTLDRFR